MKEEYSKKEKNTSVKQTHWLKKYVVFAVVLVLATSFICLTFAWYIDTVARRATVSFGEINISDDIESEKVFEQNTIIENVVPNKKIADKVSFSRAATSRDFYLRLKVRYSLETATNAVGILPWMASINRTPFVGYEGDDYSWTTLQEDGYYYLVTKDDKSMMYKVNHENTMYFSNSVDGLKFPAGNVQLLDDAGKPIQKGFDINLKIVIEAIQADIPNIVAGNETANLTTLVSYFEDSIRDFNYVEYLESTGVQYIDTGLELCEGLSSEVKFYTESKSQFLYGARNDSNTSGFSFSFTSIDRQVIAQSKTTDEAPLPVLLTYNPLNSINTLIHDEDSAKFVDSSGNEHLIKEFEDVTSYTNRRTVYLGYVNGNPSSGMFKGKIYSAKFYVNDVLVLNLRPAVMKTTNKPVFYDTVSENYYYNNGTGIDFMVP